MVRPFSNEKISDRELWLKTQYMWKHIERDRWICENCDVGFVYARLFQEPYTPWTWREADPMMLCRWCYEKLLPE